MWEKPIKLFHLCLTALVGLGIELEILNCSKVHNTYQFHLVRFSVFMLCHIIALLENVSCITYV